ncbi:MAG: Helix-turn-helix domain, partial [Chloroflexota bacterium]
MDDRAIGSAIRALRLRRGWTQAELAHRAGLSRRRLGRIELGLLDEAGLSALRSTARALDAAVAVRIRWRGEELDRLVNAAHAALHETFARHVGAFAGWVAVHEVSFSVYGERGVIDVLVWHATRRALIVVELKTSIVDVQELLGSLDRKVRLAARIAHERGWAVETIGAWIVVAETRTNRRRVAAHATLLRASYPADGRAMRRWLRRPGERGARTGGVPAGTTGPASLRRGPAALSFLSVALPASHKRRS